MACFPFLTWIHSAVGAAVTLILDLIIWVCHSGDSLPWAASVGWVEGMTAGHDGRAALTVPPVVSKSQSCKEVGCVRLMVEMLWTQEKTVRIRQVWTVHVIYPWSRIDLDISEILKNNSGWSWQMPHHCYKYAVALWRGVFSFCFSTRCCCPLIDQSFHPNTMSLHLLRPSLTTCCWLQWKQSVTGFMFSQCR